MNTVVIHLTIETNNGHIKSESIVFESFEWFGKWLAKKYPGVIKAAQQADDGMPLCPECHVYYHLLSDDTYCCLNETCSEYRR